MQIEYRRTTRHIDSTEPTEPADPDYQDPTTPDPEPDVPGGDPTEPDPVDVNP